MNEKSENLNPTEPSPDASPITQKTTTSDQPTERPPENTPLPAEETKPVGRPKGSKNKNKRTSKSKKKGPAGLPSQAPPEQNKPEIVDTVTADGRDIAKELTTKTNETTPAYGQAKCAFISMEPREVDVEVASPLDGKVEMVTRLINEEKECPNPANGLNGFCLDHSYPILKPISKVVESTVEKWVEVEGKTQKVDVKKSKNTIFNIGEHLPARHFSEAEAENFFKEGYVGKRTSMTSILTNKKQVDLTEQEIVLFLAKPADELAALIETTNFGEGTLRGLLARSKSQIVERAIQKQL